jgi:hypothetical protein
MQKLKYIPPVCLLVALFRILTGRLRYSSEYINQSVQTEDGSEFTIFRQISSHPEISSEHSCVFIVRFKFKHLSQNANRIASKIPMLLIAGHPGFVSKCYAVNFDNRYWQGMYEWKSLQDLEAYKESFVFRVMNRRAVSNSVQFKTLINQNLTQYLDNNIKYTENIALTNFPIMIT